MRDPSTPDAARARRDARAGAALALLAMGALLAACLLVSARKYFWLDELFTHALATDPSLRHMLGALARGADGAPPLYPVLAWLWARAFGAGETSLRLLTALLFCAALGVTWRTLHREYGGRAAAVGTLVTFTASPLLLRQVAEARFYGLLMLLVALGVHLALLTMRADRVRWGVWAATVAVHAALVLCHPFGGIYGAALLGALVAWDVARGQFRPAWYGAVLLGWAAFLPWLPSFVQQNRLFQPRGWIAVPEVPALLEMYRFRSPVLTAAVIVLAWLLWRRRSELPRERWRAAWRERPLLPVAAALLLVPVGAFLLSLVGPSVFLDRYFLPASLGWAVLLAHGTRALAAARPAPAAGPTRGGWRWAALAAALLLFPVGWAATRESDPLPGAGLGGLPPAAVGLPIVVERAHDYLPAAHYARPGHREAARRIAARRGETDGHIGLWGPVLFPLDSAVAFDTASPLAALTEMRLLAARRAVYGDPGVVDAAAVLCGRDRFLVLDDERYRWWEERVAPDPGVTSAALGTDAGGRVLRLVRKGAVAARGAERPCAA